MSFVYAVRGLLGIATAVTPFAVSALYYDQGGTVQEAWSTYYEGPTSYSSTALERVDITFTRDSEWVTLCTGDGCAELYRPLPGQVAGTMRDLGADETVAMASPRRLHPSACNSSDPSVRDVTQNSIEEVRVAAVKQIVSATYGPLAAVRLNGMIVTVRFSDGATQMFRYDAYGSYQTPVSNISGGSGVPNSAC